MSKLPQMSQISPANVKVCLTVTSKQFAYNYQHFYHKCPTGMSKTQGSMHRGMGNSVYYNVQKPFLSMFSMELVNEKHGYINSIQSGYF